MTDPDLFSAYLATRSEEAFRHLVDRYLPLVYASALRQLHDRHLAEDAAQAVFLVFIKKAPTLRPSTILPAWLLTTTRYVCQDARKLARRRQLHEQKAAAMSQSPIVTASDTTIDYSAITPYLDDALATLPESDRAAIILRFFDAQPLKDIGTVLHISEPTAQKRLERALQKLRTFFAGRNITLSVTAMPLALAAHTPVPALLPPALAATIAAAHTSAALSTTAFALAKSALHTLFWSPAKIAAASIALLATTSLITVSAVTALRAPAPTPVPSAETSRATEAIAATVPAFVEPVEPGFTPITEHLIRTDNKHQITFVDLDHDKVFSPPFAITINPNPVPYIDFTPELKDWIAKNNISLLLIADPDKISTTFIEALATSPTNSNKPFFFSTTKATTITAAFAARDPNQVSGYLPSQGTTFGFPESSFFKTRLGNMGILQITDPGHNPEFTTLPPTVQLRYKLVRSPILVVEIERIMGEPGGNGDPLPAIQVGVLAAANGKPDDTLPQLADAILKAKPTALRDAIMDHMTIDRRSDFPEGPFAWSYGSFQDRDNLRRRLWTNAKTLFRTNPAQARRYARAAILFRAMDDFPNGGYGLISYTHDADGMYITGLEPDKIEELESTRLDYGSAFRNGEKTETANKQIDRLFKHPTLEEFNLAIKCLDQWLAAGLSDVDQLEFAESVLQLSNHATAINNQEMIQKTKAHEQLWLKPAQGNFKRWLTQAINEPATEPERVYNLTIVRDGLMFDTDTDGNEMPGGHPQ